MDKFKHIHNRKQTRSIKWDLIANKFQSEDVLPMWIADMDFQSPKAVNDALIERAKHGIYGYTAIDQQVKDTVIDWIKKRHHWSIHSEWLSFSPGVVTSLHLAILAFTKPNDQILIQTPVYTPFYEVIQNHDRQIVTNELVYNDNRYEINFDDFENKLASGIQAFILCSPHNPVGRVWTKDELTKMTELCQKYNVLILSDEIHCDLVFPSNTHIPTASLSDDIANNTLTFMSPSKTFNIAGLQASYVITKDVHKRKLFNKQLKMYGLQSLNTMGITALEAAYREGEQWLEKLLITLESNKNYVIETIHEQTDKIKVIDAEGTYLLWLDCSNLNLGHKMLKEFMINQAKLGLNEGMDYGEASHQFMRMNIACPRSVVEKGVQQLINAVNQFH